mmetsp:Transcript_126555/g.252988  ORF Transcript_126555/g.252988 Transcript_126555/m.252988 type:complete len:174 (-) Transcript_126555:48-569(-)
MCVLARLAVALLVSYHSVEPCVGLSVVTLPDYGTDPCPFGYGTNCGGGGKISPATKAEVAKILQGILSNLSKDKALVQNMQTIGKSASKGTISKAAANSEVLGALKGLLNRIQQRGQADAAKALGGMLAGEVPSASCMYFGACGGSGRPIDAQTKAQVAAILNGIIKNLSSQK